MDSEDIWMNLGSSLLPSDLTQVAVEPKTLPEFLSAARRKLWCCARKMQRIAHVKLFTSKNSCLKWSSAIVPGFSPSFVLCSSGSWWRVMMCPRIIHLSALCGEILRGRDDAVWTGKKVLFCFVCGGNCTFKLCLSSPLILTRLCWNKEHYDPPRLQPESKHPTNKCVCCIYFPLAHPAAAKVFGEQLEQFLLAPCCGTCERTHRCARNNPALFTAVLNSGLLGCLSYLWCMSQTHPAPFPLLSNLNQNFPITCKDVTTGNVFRRVLKLAEAPLLSFVEQFLLCAGCFQVFSCLPHALPAISP